MNVKSILISGAGIAGSTLAYQLGERGFEVTMVERAAEARSSGNPVDVRGPALDVVRGMGLLPRLRDEATNVSRLVFLNARGHRIGEMSTKSDQKSDEVEVPRAVLADVLRETATRRATLLVGDHITAVNNREDGVDVEFARSSPRRFDLVIGTDGLHSGVRNLVFGSESEFLTNIGLFVATFPLEPSDEPNSDVVMMNVPGRSVSIHPSTGIPLAAFIFHSRYVDDFNYRDMDQHKALIEDAYRGLAWRVPELLDRVRTTDQLYFDAVSQVRLPAWSRGRVALLGDAASCVSLFGEGSSLAIAGAATLAASLGRHPTDFAAAFCEYEAAHRRLVRPRQRGVGLAARFLIPATVPGLATRNLGLRAWSTITPNRAARTQSTVEKMSRN